MTNREKVYTKVMKTLKQMMNMEHQGHLVTLAMMITGIGLSRNAQLSQMSSGSARGGERQKCGNAAENMGQAR